MRISWKRKTKKASHLTTKSLFLLTTLIIIMIVTILLLKTHLNLSLQFYVSPQIDQLKTVETIATNGAQRWVGNDQITPPTTAFSISNATTPNVSPLFTLAYQKYALSTNVNSLGKPLTVAFPTTYGWLQFFTSGALLLPTTQLVHTQNTKDAFADLVNNGVQDQLTGVIRLPLLQALLTAGSPLPLDGVGSSLNYIDLRNATNPMFMRTAPNQNTTDTHMSYIDMPHTISPQGVFIQTGTRTHKAVGHLIPEVVWNYVHQPAIAPNGWEHDLGTPLTEALTFTLPINGKIHHMLTQAFTYDFITLDLDTINLLQGKSVQNSVYVAAIHVHSTGLDYLRTQGLPSVTLKVQQPVWAERETVLLDTANTQRVLAHVGQNFPLTLFGDTIWTGSTLWYHAQWSIPKSKRSGWVSASSITFQSPGNTSAEASFDALSPTLASYLSNLGPNTGVVVYDVTRQRYYGYNSSTSFLSASSMKVPIMLTFLDMLEQQDREPDNDEMNLLTTMIENSNNDSASALYFNSINGSQGITSYMQKIGIVGLNSDDDAWGYSQITPQAMVNLLTLLHEGKILNSNHRALALNLMQNVETDQQVGVGDTLPTNANVALKDGWVTDTDNLWAVNSSGIVTVGNETYVVSTYTQEQSSLDSGQTIIRTICGNIASLLIP